MRERPIVAIDGPAGAGKSTVARRVAERLGYTLVDTGAMYRAIALACVRAGVAWSDADRVGEVAARVVAARELRFERDAARGVRVHLAGQDVSDAIRAADVGMGASTVSAVAAVRDALLDMQRQAGEQGAVVLEGRDIGTVVFPDAEVKFYLTASDEVRARRRYDELRARGQDVTFEGTLADVRARDAQDMGRAVAPLRQADDAVAIDSSALGIEQVVAAMVDHVHARFPG